MADPQLRETSRGVVLAVDDTAMNRKVLARVLGNDGYEVLEAEDGLEALELLAEMRHRPIDVVLLDLMMPNLDGFETLRRMKTSEALSHIPVIVVSGVEELDSVVRCIEMGAIDYLSKPFDASILRARVSTSLAAKRLRDLELEYLEQVDHLNAAAGAVEASTFEPSALAEVAARTDALGQLARTFVRMALEVRAREESLRREVRELRIEVDEARQARKVAEITDSDYFRSLRGRAAELRGIVDGTDRGKG
jgi:two-component system, cell cycle response regulator